MVDSQLGCTVGYGLPQILGRSARAIFIIVTQELERGTLPMVHCLVPLTMDNLARSYSA
jgi:hypothetical protein